MKNPNSVCYLSRISEISSIEGADKIELAKVEGWNCIVKKDSYKVDDLVIIATTDAVIPESLSESMNVTNYLRSGNRVRTVKLRGVYSECLIIPEEYVTGFNKHKEGDDLMDVLKIYKYEPPVKQITLSSGKVIKYRGNQNFPIYHKFPNIKNVTGIFNEEDVVQITRKIHGTNSRYGIVKKNRLSLWDRIKKFLSIGDEWIGYEFVVGSHNVEKGSDTQGYYDTNVWYEINDKYCIKEKLWNLVKERGIESVGKGFVIYGEIYGSGIQKGYDYGIHDIRFSGFDVMEDGEYLDTFETLEIFRNNLELPHVGVLYHGKWSQEIQDKYVYNNFIEGTKVPHEGIVVKHHTGNRSKVAKVINPDYLIYGEKNDIGDSH